MTDLGSKTLLELENLISLYNQAIEAVTEEVTKIMGGKVNNEELNIMGSFALTEKFGEIEKISSFPEPPFLKVTDGGKDDDISSVASSITTTTVTRRSGRGRGVQGNNEEEEDIESVDTRSTRRSAAATKMKKVAEKKTPERRSRRNQREDEKDEEEGGNGDGIVGGEQWGQDRGEGQDKAAKGGRVSRGGAMRITKRKAEHEYSPPPRRSSRR